MPWGKLPSRPTHSCGGAGRARMQGRRDMGKQEQEQGPGRARMLGNHMVYWEGKLRCHGAHDVPGRPLLLLAGS